jgi:hypothetical protein
MWEASKLNLGSPYLIPNISFFTDYYLLLSILTFLLVKYCVLLFLLHSYLLLFILLLLLPMHVLRFLLLDGKCTMGVVQRGDSSIVSHILRLGIPKELPTFSRTILLTIAKLMTCRSCQLFVGNESPIMVEAPRHAS